MAHEYNTDTRGVMQHYGSRTTETKWGGKVPGANYEKTVVWEFDYDDLPAGGTGNFNVSIPAYAVILSADFEIITAFTSTSTTTDLDIGLEQNDGTDIDLNGLITVTEATQTTIGTANNVIEGVGALIGEDIGAAAGELVVTPNVDDLTAGRGKVVVRYREAGV